MKYKILCETDKLGDKRYYPLKRRFYFFWVKILLVSLIDGESYYKSFSTHDKALEYLTQERDMKIITKQTFKGTLL